MSHRIRFENSRGAPLIAALAALAAAQAGAAASDGERDLSLTVYNSDLAVVRDARTMSIEQGTHWLAFTDVPARIDPTTVNLKALDEGALEMLEQNYRYDLVSQDKILERYLDSEIRVILEEGRLYEGTLLSFAGGRIVLGGAQDGEGLVILNPDKITDLQFPALPEGLITRPTLEWLLDAERRGDRRLEVSYMTAGFNWHAEYVAVVAEDDASMDLAGWVSVDNRSGATYEDAELQLVAGDVHRVPKQQARPGRMRDQENLMMAAAPAFEQEELFEYHLYTLGRRSTLRDNETKQLSLFNPTRCRVHKLYEANPQRDGTKVRVVLETTNSEEMGLGRPLPKGTVRVFQRDSRGRLQFVGEDAIDHTPRDEDVRVFLGNAFDLAAERTELASRRISQRVREVDIEVEVRNRKESEDVVVVLQENVYGDWEVTQSSRDYDRKSSRLIEFRVPVKAGQVEKVTYTIRYRY